jgi:hypothetical protein
VIDYTLALATPLGTERLRTLARHLSGGVDDGRDRLALPGLTITVREVDHPVSAEVLAEQLGVPATARVRLGVDDTADDDTYAAARSRMAVLAARLSVEADAEACLTFEVEHALLRRHAGVLTVYDWFPEWASPQVLDALPRPWVVSSDDVRF